MANVTSRTADGPLFTGAQPVHRIWLSPDGTNACSAVFYDNTAGSGTVVASLFCPATGTVVLELEAPVNIGLYVDVTTSGACRAGVVYA